MQEKILVVEDDMEIQDILKNYLTDAGYEVRIAAASHEMKTPLTILKGHLNGMINNIKGYENHADFMKRSLNVVDKMEPPRWRTG